MIPYARQAIDQADIDAVNEVLSSDFLTQGPQVPLFEEALMRYTGARHAVAVSNGTAALHIACLALGLQQGDWLWTSPITFVASANCAIYCGAEVDFVDIDPNTFTMCPEALEEKLTRAQREDRLPKIVVPVHLAGHPCDMEKIHALAQRFGFYIIEDASHAIGARYQDERIGSCRYSDMSIFSFHPVKIITTAEGGAVLTKNAPLAQKLSLLRSHGVTRDPDKMRSCAHGPWYYEQIDLGFNYRMTDLQAALGISQLNKIDKFVDTRRSLVEGYAKLLACLPLYLPCENAWAYSAFHLYIIRLKSDQLAKSHSEIFSELRKQGVGVNLHYIPVYKQPYYQAKGFYGENYCTNAENYYKEAISLPMFPLLDLSEQEYVASVIERLTRDAT